MPDVTSRSRIVDARCPLRAGDPCTLCHPDTRTGPQDCPTVWLCMDDEELRALLAEQRQAYRAAHPGPPAAR